MSFENLPDHSGRPPFLRAEQMSKRLSNRVTPELPPSSACLAGVAGRTWLRAWCGPGIIGWLLERLHAINQPKPGLAPSDLAGCHEPQGPPDGAGWLSVWATPWERAHHPGLKLGAHWQGSQLSTFPHAHEFSELAGSVQAS